MEYKIEASKIVSRVIESVIQSIFDQCKLTKSKSAILIKVTSDMPSDSDGLVSYIEEADCYLVLVKSPKSFTTANMKNMLTILAHEMVHVKQYALGIMKITPSGHTIWNGKTYRKNINYLQSPWEIDAFSRQELITRRALESVRT